AIFERQLQIGSGELRQPPNPSLQAFFIRAAALDSLSAAMLQPIGWFSEQERGVRLIPVDQRDERSSEGLDFFRRRVGGGKLETGGGSDSVGVMTGTAIGLFH